MLNEIKISLQSPAATRRQQLLTYKVANHRIKPENVSGGGDRRSDRESRMGEAAGECAAVCCCCPCAVVHFLFFAAYRLPRCLWRRKKRRNAVRNRRSSSDETEMIQRKMSMFGLGEIDDESTGGSEDHGAKTDFVAWEDEIWHGFWRSSSRRTNDE